MNTISMMLKRGMLGAMVLGMLMMVSSAAFAYRPAPAKVVTTKTINKRGKAVTTTKTTTTTRRAARPVVYQPARSDRHHARSNRRHAQSNRRHAHSQKQVVYRPVTTRRVVAQPAPRRQVVVTKTTKSAPRHQRGKLASKGLVLRW